jgi:hypothetical protein
MLYFLILPLLIFLLFYLTRGRSNKPSSKNSKRIFFTIMVIVPSLFIATIIIFIVGWIYVVNTYDPCEDVPEVYGCFDVKVKDDWLILEEHDFNYYEGGYIKGGTYFKSGENEPYSGCARVVVTMYNIGYETYGDICFEDGKPHGIWKYYEAEVYEDTLDDVCYIKGKEQKNLSKCKGINLND